MVYDQNLSHCHSVECQISRKPAKTELNFFACGEASTNIGVKGRGLGSKTVGLAMEQENWPDGSLVLVVDDDAEVLQVIAEILETLGYRVLTVRTGAEAVEQLQRNSEISVLFTVSGCPISEVRDLPGLPRRGDRIFEWFSHLGSADRVETRNSSRSHIEPLISSVSFRLDRSHHQDPDSCGESNS